MLKIVPTAAMTDGRHKFELGRSFGKFRCNSLSCTVWTFRQRSCNQRVCKLKLHELKENLTPSSLKVMNNVNNFFQWKIKTFDYTTIIGLVHKPRFSIFKFQFLGNAFLLDIILLRF